MMVANTVDQKIIIEESLCQLLNNQGDRSMGWGGGGVDCLPTIQAAPLCQLLNNQGDRSMGWGGGGVDCLPTIQAAPLFHIVTSGILGNLFPFQL